MRYAVVGGNVQQIRAAGGTSIRETQRVGVIFTSLTPEQAARLESSGCQVEKVSKVKSPIAPPAPVAAEPTYTLEQIVWAAGLEDLKRIDYPLLCGRGINLAILDTGIRETHEKISGSIVHRENYTSDPMVDGFDHGTGVASIALAAAPMVGILNMKVINNEGEGTDEGVILAIDDCISLHTTNPDIAPHIINISVGKEDDGNPNNALRTACRAAIREGIWVVAAAGNTGPDPETIMSPACEPHVIAVGSVKLEPFEVSYFSSRGPSEEGYAKPDVVMFGEDIIMASSENDTAVVARSGTSYSAPFVSGMCVLYLEAMVEQNGEILPSTESMIDILFPRVGVKPSGVGTDKDNEYGSGVPSGTLIVQAMNPVPAASPAIATDLPALMMSAIIVVGMMRVAMKQL